MNILYGTTATFQDTAVYLNGNLEKGSTSQRISLIVALEKPERRICWQGKYYLCTHKHGPSGKVERRRPLLKESNKKSCFQPAASPLGNNKKNIWKSQTRLKPNLSGPHAKHDAWFQTNSERTLQVSSLLWNLVEVPSLTLVGIWK